MPNHDDTPGEPPRRTIRHTPHAQPRGPHKRDRATRAVVVRCLQPGSAVLTPAEADAAADQLRAAANAARLYGRENGE